MSEAQATNFFGSQNLLPKPFLTRQESCHQIFLLKMAFLTVKFYDYFDYAWGGGEFRIDYVICAHSVNQEPWVQGLATVSIFLLLPLQYRGKLFGGTVPPNNTIFGGTNIQLCKYVYVYWIQVCNFRNLYVIKYAST